MPSEEDQKNVPDWMEDAMDRWTNLSEGVRAGIAFVVIVGLLIAAGAWGAYTDTDVTSESPNQQNSASRYDEPALNAAYQALKNNQHNDGIREIDTVSQVDGGYLVEARYNLDVEALGLTDSSADDAEFRAGRAAKDVIRAVAETNDPDVKGVAVYAYVPSESGEMIVSTKVVMMREEFNSIDWSVYPWQNLREDADQYKFNRHYYR